MKKMKNKFLILVLLGISTSCANYTPVYDEIVDIIESSEPLNPVESMMIDYDTPGDLIKYNTDSEGNFNSMTSRGSNRSGNLSGPSAVNLSFDKEENLIILTTQNTTGSIYSGYEQWQDTYYLEFNKGSWVYENDDNGKVYGVGIKETPTTLRGTDGYLGNIRVYEDKPNVLSVIVFGGGNSDWNVGSSYHFKGEDLIEKFQKLREMVDDIND
jgi:hypothetical protein